jgi:hypothetical protein
MVFVRRKILALQVTIFLAAISLAGCAGLASGGSSNTSGGAKSTAPSIVTQPANATVTAGQTASFSVTASGTAPLFYQWQRNNTNISGANTASYSTPATATTDSGSTFHVIVSNAAGSATSASATLTVNAAATAPQITSQPANQAVTAGQTATFVVTATGTAPLGYQWLKNSVNISGATSASYTTPATASSDNGAKYDVVVTNSVGSSTSNIATLTVSAAATVPQITSQPVNQTVTVGQSASFIVIATGTAPLSYQWQKNGVNITGAASANYITPAAALTDNAAKFDVIVTNSVGSVTSNSAMLTVNAVATAPVITVQPANQIVTAGQTAAFSVTASGTAPLSYQWQKAAADITGATTATYTTPATTTADSGSQFRVIVSNTAGSATSNTATLTVNPSSNTSSIDVVTFHYDNLRTGQNTNETTLTTANVTSATFGKLGAFTVDGKVDAQPLYLSNVAIPGKGNKNVLYVVTEHGSVYAFDADSISGNTGTYLWKTVTPLSGETSSDDRGCNQVSPEIGITATPVIDRARNAIYVVAMSKNSSNNYFQRLHALDLTTGVELFGGPTTITATYPGTGANSSGGNVVFDPSKYKERPGLLQLGGTVYTTWSSHCDAGPYTSWVMTFNADSLAQTGILNLVPNGNEGGIWMAGAAPGADAAGNVYFIIGNGDFDIMLDSNGFPQNSNCGNCFARLSTNGGMKLADYFTPLNTVSESNSDTDFGSGGELLLPDVVDGNGVTRHLAVGSGKDANIYVVDRDNMGKFSAAQDNIYQLIKGQLAGGMWSKPSYFNNTVYYGAVNDALKAFPIIGGKLKATPASQSTHNFGYPGATPTISANGTGNGIVWGVDNGGILFAYDATDLTKELYDSNQAANNRDHFSGNKFIVPMIANGKVYVGTPNSVAVFGLLP